MKEVTNFFDQAANASPTLEVMMDRATKNPPAGFRTAGVVHDSVVYEATEQGAKLDDAGFEKTMAEWRRDMAADLGIPEEMLFRPINLVEEMKPKRISIGQAMREIGQEVQGQG